MRWFAPLLLAAIVGLCTVDAGFVYDDAHAIRDSPIVRGEAPMWEAFVRDYWGRPAADGVNSWRPVMPMIWSSVWGAFPNTPLPFHLLSALLHVLCTALATTFAWRLRVSEPWAIAVGSLFAVHPLNSEAVGALVAQADIFSFCLVLVSCLVALKPPTLAKGFLAAALLLLAALVKESATLFAPLVILLFAIQRGPGRAKLSASIPVAVAAIGIVALQLALPRRATVHMWGNTLGHYVDGQERLLLGLFNIGQSLTMSVWPHRLSPSHGYAAIDPSEATLWPMALVGAVLLAVGLAGGSWAVTHRRADWIAALSFLYAPALLQSHWFIRLITDLAERLLYPATLGAAMIVSSCLFQVVKHVRVRRLAFAGLVLSALLVSVPARRAWVSNEALWTHGVEVEPKAMRHQYNLSNALIARGELDGAAFHRLLAVYLVNEFPAPVDWTRVRSLETMPAAERFVALPAALYPDAPCPIVVAFLRQNETVPTLHRHVLSRWTARYPDCFVAAPPR
ncbi:MAG: hypothetical protein AAF500_15515 [Myxococcota bacterium]